MRPPSPASRLRVPVSPVLVIFDRPPRRPSPWVPAVIALSISAVCVSCSSDSSGTSGPEAPTVASVSVTPSASTLTAAGDTLRFTATARDASGGTVGNRSFTWQSSNAGIATVNSSGLATAVATGDATVTASTAGVTGSASLSVEIPATGALRLTTATVGRNPDVDGYTLVINDDEDGPIGPNQTVTRDELAPGTTRLSLSGVADNCHPFDDYPVEATVVAGIEQEVVLGVECLGIPADINLVFVRSQPSDTTVDLVGLPEGGADPVQLTFHPSLDRAPDWSPDGSRLAFSRDGVIHVMSGDGTELRQFHEGTNPDWSPDGTRIVFESNARVFAFEPDGNQTSVFLGDGSAPAWSPDGLKIAVDVLVTQRESDIFLLNASGFGAENITNDASRVDREAAWSPDGSRIVYRHLDRRENTGYDLWIMDADGSNPQETLATPGAQILPTWLPDDRIVFTSDGGVYGIELGSGVVSLVAQDADGNLHSDGTWRTVP